MKNDNPNPSGTRYNAGTTWKPYTKALFLETSRPNIEPKFSLKRTDITYKGVVYPSIIRLYVECLDPTEHMFANTYFESYFHWQLIAKAKWFQVTLKIMREELALTLKAKAVKSLIDEARGSGKNKFQAAKYIIENDLVPGVSSEITNKKNKVYGTPELPKSKIMDRFEEEDKKLLRIVRG